VAISAKSLIRPFALALGLIAFGIGTVGIFLPLLPTTPLYLLAAACFARGSQRFHSWFLATRLYRNHLADFVKNRSMTMRTKLAICLPVTAMLAAGFYFSPIWPARAVIVLVALAKWYYFLARIKTLPPAQRRTGLVTDPLDGIVQTVPSGPTTPPDPTRHGQLTTGPS
jgi:uncharacterized membrane protein YbaN (DUF454 family)